MSDCKRVGRLFGACKWSPRYDEGAPVTYPPYEGSAAGLAVMAQAMRPKTYVRDVCETCGKTIERTPA